MTRKRSNSSMGALFRRSVAVVLLLIMPAVSFASEKYSICVYNKVNVAGVSAEAAAEIDQAVRADLSSRNEFNLIKNADLQGLIGLYSKDEKVGEEQLLEAAKFAGIDYFLLLDLTGEVKPSSDKLDELFDQNGAHPLNLSLRLLDLSHNKTLLEVTAAPNTLSAAKDEINKELSGLKLDYKRGKVTKLSDHKIEVDLGQKNGVVEGVAASIYKTKEIKAGKLDLYVPGEKIGEAIFEKADQDKSLAKVLGDSEVVVGDYVEIFEGQLVSAPILPVGQENSVVVAGQANGGFVVVPAQKPFISAESRLKDFAKKAEEARMQSAMYGVGLGLLYISLGSAYSSSYYGSNYSSIYYGLGAGMTILGVRSYLFPTELESNYGKIRQMTSSTVEERGAREAFAERSLKQGADEAQQGRTIASGLLVGVGLLSGSSGVSLLYVGLGAMQYIMKSDIEKTYDEYVSDKDEFVKSQGTAGAKKSD